MSRIEKGFTPIKEAQSERVNMRELDLPPYVNPDRVGANLRRIERLCRIGGINHVRVIGVDDTTEREVPMVVGVDSQGGAVVGKGKEKSVELFDTEKTEYYGEHTSIDLVVGVNLQQISEAINEQGKWSEGVRSSDAWANFLNKSLKTVLRQNGKDNLLSINTSGITMYGVFIISSLGLLTYDFRLGAVYIPTVFLSQELFLNITLKKSRISLFPFGFQADRALILQGVSLAGGKLVKEIGSKNPS